MINEPFYAPFRKPRPPAVRQPGEHLFAFVRGHDRFLCELRDHGQHGVEAQFWQNEEFLHSRRFDTRDLAVLWADGERKAMEKPT